MEVRNTEYDHSTSLNLVIEVTNCDLTGRMYMASTKEKAEIVPVTIQVKDIGNSIYSIRDKQVMLDHDLAVLYGYEVKRLNEQVKRNIARFHRAGNLYAGNCFKGRGG